MSSMRFQAAIAAAACLAGAAGSAGAATLVTVTYTGVVTQSVSDFTFGNANLIGMTYTAAYVLDPTLGTVGLYDPGGGVFDYTRAGNNAASPIRTLTITINGFTDVIDFGAPSSSYGSANRFNNPGGPYSTMTLSGQAGRTVPSPTGGLANDFVRVGSSIAVGMEIPFDMAAPWSPSGPIMSGSSGFQRQVQNAGRGYDQAYNIGGTVTGVHVALAGAVPEPGTWALMIAGFGGAGVALRRRRALAA